MKIDLVNKSSIFEIRERFDKDVDRFSNLETGQKATIDAPLAMELIAQAATACNPNAKKILDLGCGAGNNTLKMLQFINPLDCDINDLSKPMLDKAYERISAVNKGNIRIFHDDFRDADLPKGYYDIILAAAVFHHLRDDQDWENTFRKVYEITAPGGSFWITDLVFHEITEVQRLMWNRYGNYLESIGGIEARDKVFKCIEIEDSPRPVTYQLELLRKVGFKEVDILHKNSCFAAFGARKI